MMTQLAHRLTTLYGGCYDVKMLKRRPHNVVLMSCAGWGCKNIGISNMIIICYPEFIYTQKGVVIISITLMVINFNLPKFISFYIIPTGG